MLVGSAGVGTAAPAGPTDGGDAVEHVSEPHVLPVDVTVDRTPDRPGHARVTYSMEVSQAVSRVVVALPESYAASRQSVTTDGFSQVSGEPRPVYEAIPTGRQTLSLTVEVQSTDVSVLGDEQYPMAYDTGSWAYFPDVFPFMRAVTESGTYEPHYRVQAGDGAVVENGAVFVGEYNETTRAVGGERVHLVVPEGVSMASSETAVLDAVAAASERLPVGGRNDEVYAVALGYDRSEVNARGVARGNTMWAKADVPAGAVDNTWVHEYVHTRQAFETESELDWFVEGSAAYLDVAIPLMRGNGTPAEARRHLRGQYDGRLDDPDSWASQRIQYRRGGRAVALLNRLIVEASDGEQTVVTVFRELNSRAESSGRTLTGGDLRTAVI